MSSRARTASGEKTAPKAAAPQPSSNFVFIEVDLDESKSDKYKRISKARSHITTQFYKDQRACKENQPSASKKSRGLRPKRQQHTAASSSGSPSDAGTQRDCSHGALQRQQIQNRALLSALVQPALERMDPFDALPVRGDVRIDRTMQLWRLSPAPNLLPYTGINSWGGFAGPKEAWRLNYLSEDDSLMFHLRLLAASFWCDLLLERRESVETMFFRQQVLRGTQDRLKNRSTQMSTLLVVSHLAINTGIEGKWHESELHLEAVRRLIKGQGGYEAIPLPVRRVIFWNEFNAGAIMEKGPRWPVEYVLDPDAGELPEDLLQTVEERQKLTAARFPPGVAYPQPMMYYLHLMSLVDCEWTHLAEHPAVGNIFYRYTHGYYLAATSPVIQKGTSDAAVMLKTLFWATRVYVKSTLGHSGVNPIYTIWLARLKKLLAESEGLLLWFRSKGLDLLIWILFVGLAHSDAVPPIQDWFIVQLRYVCTLRQIADHATFESLLRNFPWAAEFPQKTKEAWVMMTDVSSGHSIAPFGKDSDGDDSLLTHGYCLGPQPLVTYLEKRSRVTKASPEADSERATPMSVSDSASGSRTGSGSGSGLTSCSASEYGPETSPQSYPSVVRTYFEERGAGEMYERYSMSPPPPPPLEPETGTSLVPKPGDLEWGEFPIREQRASSPT